MSRKKVGVLISGRGTNLQALIDACRHPDYPVEIVVVISNKTDALGLTRARDAGIAAQVLDHKLFNTRGAWDNAAHKLLVQHHVEIVCLAGFMRLLTAEFVGRWQDKLLNVHPSLLPSFKGLHPYEEAISAGARFSGCTVHLVRAEMDVGPIVLQAVVPVLPDDNKESLAARILVQEHRCYPQALRWLAEGRLTIAGNQVTVKGAQAGQGTMMNPV